MEVFTFTNSYSQILRNFEFHTHTQTLCVWNSKFLVFKSKIFYTSCAAMWFTDFCEEKNLKNRRFDW